jgi:ribonucleoside-diphosphate reductase alpha chain
MTYDNEGIQKLVKNSPYYKATSNDVDWLAKVKMQGQIQKWVDHSISVTINLPNDAKEDLVGDLYIQAWQSGCKGVTVYRDGSRTGVLISNEEKKKASELLSSMRSKPVRPKVLEAEIQRFMHNNEKWIAFIGILDGRPYEIFTGNQDDDMFPIPKKIEKGLIIKNKDEEGVTRYDFQYTDKFGYKNTMGGLSHQFNKEYWNYAKLISSVLRFGMPIDDVVDLVNSLRLDNDAINTWTAGVVRALKKYVPNGTKAGKKEKCSECGSEELVYEEGCLKCSSCGNAKCG